ncbi:GNAT family N-acetyltransferase [Phenylobacterium immobile]|uniref:GNAT family N-acetyltransferase n=1 Tax=Phenylobacterium immobile TaxID=21 RepID=UPI000B0209CA|nr:GNAT family N-acetyltransferase [Phenylobacterium immobile]
MDEAKNTDGMHCAGIETHRDFRQRGHAVAAANAGARAVRKLGAEPLYSTSWENAASLAVARRLGLRQVATDFHVT